MRPGVRERASNQLAYSASRSLGSRIRLSQQSGTPIYMQLADQLKYLIGTGELPPGSRLPSARLLSSNLNINRNTVLSAYTILAAESYVRGHRGGGTLVASSQAEQTDERTSQFNPELLALIDELVSKASPLGLCPDQIAALVASHARMSASATRLKVAFVECNPHSYGGNVVVPDQKFTPGDPDHVSLGFNSGFAREG